LLACAYAQDTGYISGTVVDKSGAAIAGADVTVRNTAGSITRTTPTNNDGAYTIAVSPAIATTLRKRQRIQKYIAQNIKLNVGENHAWTSR